MRATVRHTTSWVIVFGVIAGAIALAQSSPSWTPVTAERLLKPESGDWMSYRRTYDVTAFSPLRRIDRSTVRQLRPVWSYSMRDNRRWLATPIVANGLMYVPEGSGRVTAFDAVSGDVTLQVALQGDGNPNTPAEGVSSGGGCPPCLAGFRVFGAVVPRGNNPTPGQFLELPLNTGAAQGTNAFGSQVLVRADCNPSADQDLYLAVQLVGEGAGLSPFKAQFLSNKSTRVPCGSNLADPGNRGSDPRPDRGRDTRR